MASGSTLSDIKEYTQGLVAEWKAAFLTNFDVKSILTTIKEVGEGATEVTRVFGQGKEQIIAIRAAMAEAVTSVTLLGGGFSDILKIQMEVGKALGTNLILNSQSYEKLYATTKVTGIEATTLTTNFKDAGFSVYAIGDQMTKVMDVSRSIGVNGREVSAKVVENMSKMNQFNFQGGVEGLAKMAAQAVNLRVNMNDVFTIANRLFDPEQAIDMAAAMQRLGVAQGDLLDPLRLMDLAQNDPAELQNQIAEMSKSFTRLKADGTGFEILPGEKLRMMELEKAMQLPTGQLAKMGLASADLGLKMSKIKFSDDVADEDTQKLIANMAEMGEGGVYKVTYTDEKGKVQTKNVTELDEKDIKAITEASQKPPKTMEELAKDQLKHQESIDANIASIKNRTGYGFAGKKTVTEAEGALREVAGVIPKAAGGKNLSIKGIREETLGLDNFIKAVGDGKGMEALMTSAKGTATWFENTTKEFGSDTKNAMNDLSKSDNSFLQGTYGLAKKMGNEVLEHENMAPKTVKAKDFVITTLPEDEVRIVGGTNLDGGKSGGEKSGGEKSTMKVEDVNVNLSVKIDAPPNIDTAQLALIFQNDQSIKETLLSSIRSALGGTIGSDNLNPIETKMANMANRTGGRR